MKQRIELQQGEIIKGDPATVLLGRPEEQPARVHKPLPPVVRTEKHILADIRLRMQELRPLVEEYPALVEADKVLKNL